MRLPEIPFARTVLPWSLANQICFFNHLCANRQIWNFTPPVLPPLLAKRPLPRLRLERPNGISTRSFCLFKAAPDDASIAPRTGRRGSPPSHWRRCTPVFTTSSAIMHGRGHHWSSVFSGARSPDCPCSGSNGFSNWPGNSKTAGFLSASGVRPGPIFLSPASSTCLPNTISTL